MKQIKNYITPSWVLGSKEQIERVITGLEKVQNTKMQDLIQKINRKDLVAFLSGYLKRVKTINNENPDERRIILN